MKREKGTRNKEMGKYLKTRVMERLKGVGFAFEPLPKGSTPHKRGVHYLRMCVGVDFLLGAMDEVKEGQKYRKRIVVRQSRYRDGLFELYTYHFPKRWSAACVENREMIKEAQRRAHALEKDFTPEGLEWRIRFFNHYFRVFNRKEKPEEGFKAYSRFYQYTYVAIYRQLKEAAQKAKEEEEVEIEEISFEPVDFRPRLRAFQSPLRRAYSRYREDGKRRDKIPHNEQSPPAYDAGERDGEKEKKMHAGCNLSVMEVSS